MVLVIFPPWLFRVKQGAENDDGGFFRAGHGIGFGGRNDGVHVRRRHMNIQMLHEKIIELFLQGGGWRLAGGQLVQQDFKDFGFHGMGSINSARQPRMTLRLCVGSRAGRFISGNHEKALDRMRPVPVGRAGGFGPAMATGAFMAADSGFDAAG
jgi:hypothetical protein